MNLDKYVCLVAVSNFIYRLFPCLTLIKETFHRHTQVSSTNPVPYTLLCEKVQCVKSMLQDCLTRCKRMRIDSMFHHFVDLMMMGAYKKISYSRERERGKYDKKL